MPITSLRASRSIRKLVVADWRISGDCTYFLPVRHDGAGGPPGAVWGLEGCSPLHPLSTGPLGPGWVVKLRQMFAQ